MPPTKKSNKPGETEKNRVFAEVYDGDVKKAAKIAGLGYSYCRKLVMDTASPYIKQSAIAVQEIIGERRGTEQAANILTRQQRQEFWSETVTDEEQDITTRLRASELLGKSELDFGERRQEVQAQSLADIAALMYVHRKKVDSKAIEGESDAV